MDKIIFKAESLLQSIKMGASIDKNNYLLEAIQRIQTSGSIKYIDATAIYDNTQISRMKLEENKYFNALKNAIERVENNVDNYTATNLAVALKNYKTFKESLEVAKKSNNELNTVIDIFGEFSTNKMEYKRKKRVETYKTTEELTDERNERLAILNEMYESGQIDADYFKKVVVSVRRVYQRATERSVSQEYTENVQKITTKEKISKLMKGRISNLARKIANVFKINNLQKENKDSFDYEKFIINQNAMRALGSVSDIIAETEDCAKISVIDEIKNLSNTAIEIHNTGNEERVIDIKTALKIMKVDIMLAQNHEYKDILINQSLNYGQLMVADSNGRLVPNRNIRSQKEAYIEYMHKNNETYFETSPSGMPIEKFKDKKVEKEYEDTLQKFDCNIERVKELSAQWIKYNEQLKTKIEGLTAVSV